MYTMKEVIEDILNDPSELDNIDLETLDELKNVLSFYIQERDWNEIDLH